MSDGRHLMSMSRVNLDQFLTIPTPGCAVTQTMCQRRPGYSTQIWYVPNISVYCTAFS